VSAKAYRSLGTTCPVAHEGTLSLRLKIELLRVDYVHGGINFGFPEGINHSNVRGGYIPRFPYGSVGVIIAGNYYLDKRNIENPGPVHGCMDILRFTLITSVGINFLVLPYNYLTVVTSNQQYNIIGN
jgi:hypothetical protein